MELTPPISSPLTVSANENQMRCHALALPLRCLNEISQNFSLSFCVIHEKKTLHGKYFQFPFKLRGQLFHIALLSERKVSFLCKSRSFSLRGRSRESELHALEKKNTQQNRKRKKFRRVKIKFTFLTSVTCLFKIPRFTLLFFEEHMKNLRNF